MFKCSISSECECPSTTDLSDRPGFHRETLRGGWQDSVGKVLLVNGHQQENYDYQHDADLDLVDDSMAEVANCMALAQDI